MKNTPLFSILTPVYDPPLDVLEATIGSVLEQECEDWEWILVDDCSTTRACLEVIAGTPSVTPGIRLVRRETNGHIVAASNDALDAARGEFVVLLDHDDLLTPDALARNRPRIEAHHDVDFLYSDEDKVSDDGARTASSPSRTGPRSGSAARCTPPTCRSTGRRSSARSAASATASTDRRTTTSPCASERSLAGSSTSPRCSTTGARRRVRRGRRGREALRHAGRAARGPGAPRPGRDPRAGSSKGREPGRYRIERQTRPCHPRLRGDPDHRSVRRDLRSGARDGRRGRPVPAGEDRARQLESRRRLRQPDPDSVLDSSPRTSRATSCSSSRSSASSTSARR